MWIFNGNITELKNVGKSLRKSFLFLLTAYHPKIRLFRARVQWLVKHNISIVSSAFLTTLENPRE